MFEWFFIYKDSKPLEIVILPKNNGIYLYFFITYTYNDDDDQTLEKICVDFPNGHSWLIITPYLD